MGQHGTRPGEGAGVDTKDVVQPPRMYKVIIHNDDYTTMEFVVDVLTSIFRKPLGEAVRIMLSVHHRGSGLCGVYPRSVAETKVDKVHEKAREQGYPLRCSTEPE